MDIFEALNNVERESDFTKEVKYKGATFKVGLIRNAATIRVEELSFLAEDAQGSVEQMVKAGESEDSEDLQEKAKTLLIAYVTATKELLVAGCLREIDGVPVEVQVEGEDGVVYDTLDLILKKMKSWPRTLVDLLHEVALDVRKQAEDMYESDVKYEWYTKGPEGPVESVTTDTKLTKIDG